MAKRAVRRKVSKSSPKYKHFRLHGDHSPEKVYFYSAVSLITGIALGLLLQAFIPF